MGIFTTKEKRQTERKSIAQITETLMKMQEDLKILEDEKNGHMDRLENEIAELQAEMAEAKQEKERGGIIFENIKNLLGGDINQKVDTVADMTT